MKLHLTCCIFFFIALHLSAQNVGINTNMPGADLHVNGDVKITDGTQGDGKVLTSGTTGLASWQLPKTYFTLGTDQSVSTNNFVGLGSGSSVFIRNTIVIPFNGTITSLIFSARQASPSTVTCEIYKSSNGSTPVATGIIAAIPPFAYFGSVTGNFVLNQGDLISVKITSSGGSITDGVTATIGYQ